MTECDFLVGQRHETDASEPKAECPPVTPGSVWQHYNGGIYTVRELYNPDNPETDDKPPMVGYQGANGKLWARRLSDWHRSFTRLYGP